jgi:hypothetical protein
MPFYSKLLTSFGLRRDENFSVSGISHRAIAENREGYGKWREIKQR